jgi:DNA-binding NtrC family response regulator
MFYVTPRTRNSQRAIRNLDALCHEHLPVQLEVEVIDLTEHPGLAASRPRSATSTTTRSSSNGQHALDLWQRATTPFDLVITDVVMAEMSGWALGEQIHAESPAQKSIYPSGYSQEVLAQHGAASSTFILLQKPFTRLDLLRTVRDTLDRQR